MLGNRRKSEVRIRLLYIINVDWYFQLHWLDRARAAIRDGFEVHLACQFTDNEIRLSLERESIHCHAFDLTRSGINPLQEIRSLRSIYRLVKAISPHLIHTVTVKPNLYGGIACRNLGIPTIASVTGLGSIFAGKQPVHRLMARCILLACKYLSQRKDYYMLFENTADRALFLQAKSTHDDRSTVVSGAGVDTRRFRYTAPVERQPLRVLFAARLIKEKGLEALVEAVRKIQEHSRGVELWVAGIADPTAHNPISESQLHDWQRSGQINYLGKRNDMEQLLAEVDVVCLPTTYREGIPRILIEAGAVGRPVITTEAAGCSELIEHGVNGYLVKSSSPDAVASAISRLRDDFALRERIGKNARRIVEERFSSQLVIAQHRRIYESILENRGQY